MALPLLHRFKSLDGSITVDVDGTPEHLDGYESVSEAGGFYLSATGRITETLATANPTVFTYGGQWFVYDADPATNEPVWAGQLVDSQSNGGVVTLHAEGWAKKADKEYLRLLWETRDEADFTIGSTNPFDLADDDQIEAQVRGRTLRWRVRRKAIFKKKAGAPASWWSAIVYGAPTADVNRFVANITKPDGPDADYDLELFKMPWPTGTVTVVATYSMGSGGPGAIDEAISGAGTEVIGLRLKRTTELKKADGFRLVLKDVRVRDMATSSNYKTHQCVTDIAAKVAPAWGTARVAVSTQNAMPADYQGVSAGDVLDEMALLDDWVWGVEHDGTNKQWVYRAWGNTTWILDRASIFAQQSVGNRPAYPVEVEPRDRFNICVVPFRYGGGFRGEKRVTASPNTMPGGITQTLRVDLEDPLPSEEIAGVFGQRIADYYVTKRFSGQLTCTEVSGGTSAWRVKPGDKVTLPDQGGLTLRIERVTQTGDRVTIEFAGGQPFLERALARRRLLLNRGRSSAAATLAGLGIKRPAVPTFPGSPLTFSLQIRKNNHRDYDAIANWNEVTDDTSSPAKATAIQAYVVQMRAVDSGGTPIAGYDILHKRVSDKDDGDADDFVPTKVRFERVQHPRSYRYQIRVRAEDVLGRRSAWSVWMPTTAVLPTAETPPLPFALAIDVDQTKVHGYWDSNRDPDDNDEIDPRIHHFHYRFKDYNGNVVRRGNTKDYMKTIKWRKPGSSNVSIEVCSVDANGSKSAFVSATGNRVLPPTPPFAPFLSFQDGGKMKVTVKVFFDYDPGSFTDDDFDKFQVELEDDNRRRRQVIDIDSSEVGVPQDAYFKNVKHGSSVKARFRVMDTKKHKSGWSPWTTTETVADPGTPPAPTFCNVVTRLRGIEVQIGRPTGAEELDHYEVELRNSADTTTVASDLHVKRLQVLFRIAASDGAPYRARVRSIYKGSAKVSAWVSSGGQTVKDRTQTDDYTDLSVKGGASSFAISNDTISDYNIGSLSADKIVAGVITAIKFQTSTSGDRIVMRDSGGEADRIKFIGSGGDTKAVIKVNGTPDGIYVSNFIQCDGLQVATLANTPPAGFVTIYKDAGTLKAKDPSGVVRTLCTF